MYFKLHPNRTTNFTVYVQTGAGTFTNFTPDVARTYLGYATNRSDVLACATLLPNGQIWARVVLGNSNSLTWYFQNGTTTASSTSGSPTFTAAWPTTANIGTGGAGTNIYAARTGVDVRWSYLNACGGNLNTVLQHAEQSVMAANLYYLQNAGILHRLERVIIRSDQASDPYETTTSSLLSEEHTQWKYTLPAALGVGVPDLSVLPSPGYGGGVAFRGQAGTSAGQAVTDVRSLEFDLVWRHEVGHNWNSLDYQGGQAEGGTIMNGNGAGRFSGPELYKIVGLRNTRANLFENLGRYAFRLPPHAALDLATTSVTTPATIVDVLDNDHSAIGSPITIKSFDPASANGATITRSAGTGAGGRDQLIYMVNPQSGLGMDRFAYQIQDTNGMTMTGNVFVQVTPPVSDLAGHWPLDETSGTIAHDLSGSGNDGTAQTNNAWTDGVFGGALNLNGQALTVDGTDDILVAGALSGSGSILKQGTGNLIVSGTNSLTATVRVNSGMLQIGNGGGSGDIGIAAVTNHGAVKFFRTNSFLFANVISGSGSVVQAGAGTVTVTGSNTYSGTTTISAGTLALSGGDNRLPTNTTVIFSANATFNVGTNSQTLSSVDLNDNVTAVVAGAGGTLMANGAADFRIGGGSSGASQTVDMSGLANFVFNQSGKAFDAGGQTANNVGASSGTVTLATNNTITAAAFGVADAGAYPANANTGTVNLGGSNVLNAGTITIGGGGGWVGTGTVKFRSGMVNPSLTLRNTAGTGRATVTVGYVASSDYSIASGTVDLTNGVSGLSTLDAQAGTLTIGKHAYANVNYDRAATGNFVMGGGTLDVTALVIGQKNYSGGRTGSSASGTLSLNGGTVIANTLTLGDQVGNNGPSVSGTFNLNGGGTLRAQTIQPGAGTASRPFNWNSSTIRNYDANTNLTIASGLTLATTSGGTHDFNIDAARTGTINAILAGGGAITKSGAGSVTATATNTYTGSTTINAGTFALGAAGSIAASPVITVAGGALFDVASVSGFTIGAAQKLQGFGSVRGSPTIAGTLAPGGSIGTLTFSNNLILTGTTLMEIARTNGAATNDQAVVAGTVTFGGSLVVTNLGMEPLQWGDTFKLFSAGVRNGSFASTNLPPLTLPLYWTNRLAADGTIAVATTVNTLPTNVVVGVNGTNLTLAWPADYTGWRLLVQTNPPGTGLGTNWFTWPNSTNLHSVSVPINQTNASVFFKLVYP